MNFEVLIQNITYMCFNALNDKAPVSPDRIVNVDLSYLPKCVHFIDLRK